MGFLQKQKSNETVIVIGDCVHVHKLPIVLHTKTTRVYAIRDEIYPFVVNAMTHGRDMETIPHFASRYSSALNVER